MDDDVAMAEPVPEPATGPPRRGLADGGVDDAAPAVAPLFEAWPYVDDDDVPPPPVPPGAVVAALAGLVTAGLLLVMSLIPAPYVIETPGPTVDTLGEVDGEPLIEIDGASTYPTSGVLRLTTVAVVGGPGRGPVDALAVVRGWLSSADAVLPEEVVYPPDRSRDELDELSALEMTTSQENATAAALTALGYDVPAVLTVADAVPGTGAEGVLDAGDVLLAVGGVELASFRDLSEALAATPPGTAIAVDVSRGGDRVTVEVVTGDDGSGGSVLGVYVDPLFDFPVDVKIRIEDIGGPSAGTMFALGIVDSLTPGELTGGRDVAGTGTISVDGEVGPISGIRQKMVGAARDGATIFLAPAGNCDEVVGNVPPGLVAVRVATLDEAIDALTEIGDDRLDALPACEAG